MTFALLAGVLLAAAAVRLLLFARYPLFLTHDSADFLQAAEAIGARFDYFHHGLRDWRLPGYPTFLAAIYRWLPWNATSILAVQTLLGLGSTLLAMIAAHRLAGRWGAVACGAFLAFHPGYLFQEHMAMAECLFVFLLWGGMVLAVDLVLRRTPPGVGYGLTLGALTVATILTRSNGMFLLAPLLTGAVAVRLWRSTPEEEGSEPEPSRPRRPVVRRLLLHLPFLIGCVVAGGTLWGAWMVRNHAYLGEPRPFTDNVNRSRIVYLAQHDLLDPGLPAMAGYRFDPEHWPSAYDIMLHQLPIEGGEAEAARIVHEQIRAQPAKYVTEAWRGVRHFLGWRAEVSAGCQVMRFWFLRLVVSQERVERHNRSVTPPSLALEFDRRGRQGRVLRAWREAGLVVLDRIRPALTGATVLTCLVWFGLTASRRVRHRRAGEGKVDVVIALLAVSLALVVVAHGLLLADHDRYAVPFDGMFLLLLVTAVSRLRALWTSRGRSASAGGAG